MKYGYFDDEQREYVITRPDTPLPWINYLGCEDFFGLISNTAGGYAFYQDARLRRLTRYRYNNVPLDTGGRYIYLRDHTTGRYWSPTWQPVRLALEEYTCRHGLGYTCIQSSFEGIHASLRYFVPLGNNLEVWQVQLTNRRKDPAQLTLFSAIEFCLWDAQDDATNFQRNLNVGEVEVEGSVIYHKTEYRERRDHFAYFACSEPLAGFDTQREAFLGPYHGWDAPQAVVLGACRGSLACGWAPVGVHQVELSLQPGETRRVIFLLGYHQNPAGAKFDPPGSNTINKTSVRPVIAHYLQDEAAEAAFRALRRYWEGLLAVQQVHTPDPHTNRMVNLWNAYQCMVTFNLSRSASYFESGIGRGMGFRDSNQDLLGFVHMQPARARQRILDLAATQLTNGGAYHQYQPLTKRGNDQIGSGFNDDPLWLILSTAAYIKETGDWTILDECAPFDNQPGSQQPLYTHLQRSLRYTQENLGPHGLPLIGRADWNDCLNLNTFSETPGESFQTAPIRDAQTAESIFIAGLFVLAAGELQQIAARRGDDSLASRVGEASQSIMRAMQAYGWDGSWFLRAYDAGGQKIGSHECAEGKIFVETQGMSVMAGVGLEDGRAHQALRSVHEHLATPHGVMLHHPAFTHYSPRLGEISSYPPGYKENSGVFCHTNPWIMIAETRLGHGDLAHDYYRRINPSYREAISDIHRCEPYVYAQMIAGRDAPAHGEAKNSWLTGAAAWNYVAITQYILGIRPDYDGLVIDPVIPAGWEGFSAVRRFRGVEYHIRVGWGERREMRVEGTLVEGIHVSPPREKPVVEVQLTLKRAGE